MNRETLSVWTARLLLGFVLITMGFAAGRRTAPAVPTAAMENAVDLTAQAQRSEAEVVVYAAHMTFRCPECTQIEWLARELIEKEFADELADGRLSFRTVDYMRDTTFARKFNISSSTLVITRGGSDDYKRLDEVWTRIRNRDDYFDYVRTALNESLGSEAVK